MKSPFDQLYEIFGKKMGEYPHISSQSTPCLIHELIFNKILTFHDNVEIHDILFICDFISSKNIFPDLLSYFLKDNPLFSKDSK